MEKEPMVLFNAYLPLATKYKMGKIKVLTNMSLSDMVRRALDVWLIREEAKARLANPVAFDAVYHPEQKGVANDPGNQ